MAITTPLNATNAYGMMSRLANHGQDAQAAAVPGGTTGDFGAMVKDQIQGVLEAGNVAEARQTDLLAGKANLIDVVTAVSETEVALETMVSVRDRVIAAYEEIMRMPI